MIHMNSLDELPVEVVVGEGLGSFVGRPLPPYSKEAVSFLSDLSRRLLNNPSSRRYPDIAGFAYWCRKANLSSLQREFDRSSRRIGRGIVFHVAPANVPVNFAFSLAFGILAGNANIVRLPTADHEQARIICSELESLFALETHNRLASMTRVIRYQANDEITTALSSISNARVLWGGDATIKHLRNLPSSPRCVDISFADRYSICILNSEAIEKVDQMSFDRLINGFYNDVFLLDQNACSSPHLILWQGSKTSVRSAQSRFWTGMETYLSQKAPVQPVHAVEKFTHLCRTAIELEGCAANLEQSNAIIRVSLDSMPRDIEAHRGKHGFFFEAIDNDLEGFDSIVGERYQTVTYFGIDPEVIVNRVVNAGLPGVDRVVPVGKALDIGVKWDGYDLINSLSRVITC